MYLHQEIQLAVLPLLQKYDLERIDLLGELQNLLKELQLCETA